ncbi:SusC/RagA family TonB-linked outer membrane protein [Chitinophaga cymbidii]|uniref:SusC/RagA family TonB-linked outer membrane protein n=1 Tax=Chitinophaga cymbidii TaxID=1096750 RepID=A0A512RQR7_9BACT|nr:SusC/RagA family TonB-linked outer membrane protein [Chitinophaga cymbidii]
MLVLPLLHASGGFAQDVLRKGVSITLKEKPLDEALQEISAASKVKFAYPDKLVKQQATITRRYNDARLEQILNDILQPSGLTYEVVGSMIVIKKAVTTPAPDNTSQEKITASGVVTDSTGTPLFGVSVMLKGSPSTGTSTSENGAFALQVPAGASLVLSMIGFVPQEVAVRGQQPLRITLLENRTGLNEVVVVGFGTQRKITLTGSVASIQTKELKQSAVSNLSSALVGRLPGLMARQSSGEPGANGSSIWLRGQSTYSGGNGPLIMIDGVPRDGFEFIDPNEVESITILKDASSTAVYGVRGANGVVLVTTKRGTVGKPSVQFNVESAMNTPTRLPEYLNSVEYFRYYRAGLINDGRLAEAEKYTDEFISRYDRSIDWPAELEYEYLYPNVDWLDYMLKDHSWRTTANVNVRGGAEKFKYFVSGSYFTEDGIYNHDDAIKDYNIQANEKRFNFRSNIDMEISKWFKAELGLSTIVRYRNYPTPPAGEYFISLKTTAPYEMPVFNPDGSIAEPARGNSNPYAQLTQRGYKRMLNSYLQGTVGFTADLRFITKGLTARTRFSYDALSNGGFERSKNYWSFLYEGNGEYTQVKQGQDFLNYSTMNDYWQTQINPEFYINYDRRFGKHDVSGMVLYRLKNESRRATNFVDGLPRREQGLVGRIAYGYNEKYFAEANFGYNGSENFMTGRRFGFFPSFSVGWVINREAFMEEVRWIDLLKIRLSHGMVGNQDPGTRFAYQSQWNLSAGGYNFGYDYQNNKPGALEGKTGNPLTSWETARMTNLGLDFNIKNSLLSLTADMFYEKRTGIFTTSSRITSALMGIPAGNLPTINAGMVENKGFEVDLKHQKQLGRYFSYFIRGNYTYARNKILDYLEEPTSDRPWQTRKGRSLNDILTYVATGYFQSQDEIDKAPSQAFFGTVQPGDVRYLDVNGDGIIDSYDRTYIGKDSEPTSIMGASAGFSYRGFDFSILFQGGFGRWLFTDGSTMFGTNYEFRQVMYAVGTDYWTPENTNAAFPRAMSQKTPNNTERSTHYLRNGNYVRLKNMEIGYSLPVHLIKRLGMANVRIYANGNNLYTWDQVKLFDPEENYGSPSYPLMSTYNFGINVGF